MVATDLEDRAVFSFALPFGAAAAVLAFNWTAAALCHVMCHCFALGTTNFFDDFHVIEEDALCEHTEKLVGRIFDLLGWELKSMPSFSSKPAPLGALFDLDGMSEGSFKVGNKPERALQVSAQIREITEASTFNIKDMEKLRGESCSPGPSASGDSQGSP